jgi:hypothetical protein
VFHSATESVRFLRPRHYGLSVICQARTPFGLELGADHVEIDVVGAGDVTFSDASAISPPGRRFGPAELPMAFVECLHKGPVGKHVLAPRAAGVPLSGSDVLADYVDVVVVDGRRERRRWGGWFKR